MVMAEFVTESVLVKIQAFIMNGKEQFFSGFGDRICL